MLSSFVESLERPLELVGEEARWLGMVEAAGLVVAPGMVVHASAEESFYLSNNLPEQLRKLFAHINPRRIDEDALEDACARAESMVTGSVLLEDFTSLVGIALTNLRAMGELHMRRPGETASERGTGRPGALVALKRLWARDWSFDAVLQRIEEGGSVGMDARPTLLFTGPLGGEDPDASARAAGLLGRPVTALTAGGLLNGLLP